MCLFQSELWPMVHHWKWLDYNFPLAVFAIPSNVPSLLSRKPLSPNVAAKKLAKLLVKESHILMTHFDTVNISNKGSLVHYIFDWNANGCHQFTQIRNATGSITNRCCESKDSTKKSLPHSYHINFSIQIYFKRRPSAARPRSKHRPNMVVSMLPPQSRRTTLCMS